MARSPKPQEPENKVMGRPTIYSEELATEIINRLSTSTVGLKKTCADLDIGITTIWRWIAENKNFRERYDAAKELQVRLMTEELNEITDDRSLDILPDGRLNGVAVARDKLRLDARKYLIDNLKPNKKLDNAAKKEYTDMLHEAMEKANKARERDY